MTNNTKRFILLQVILFTLFPIQSMGQSEYAIKQKIQESLEEFMNLLSYVNDEEEVISPSMIATRYSGGNYFRFNGKEMKLQNFIEDYCYSVLQRQLVNHSLSISPNNITKVSKNPSDQRWSVNGILKRGYATNKRDNISDESVRFVILWRGKNEELGLLEIDFHSQTEVLRANTQSVYSEYIIKATEKLDLGDCDGAQLLYDVYKDLTGNTIPSLEALIDDCKNVLHIGDIMDVNGEKYTVAHLTGNKKHGFAIRDIGVYSLNTPVTYKYLDEQMIPTLVETDTVYKNNEHIGLTGIYWTSTKSQWIEGPFSSFFVKDFLTGKTSASDQRNKKRMLIIHRF